jgi:hypothetical protein
MGGRRTDRGKATAQPRRVVAWGCTTHRTPAGTECVHCANQRELFPLGDLRGGGAVMVQPDEVARSQGRVLVTGSRTWTDEAVIARALGEVWGDGTSVLVSGGCPRGADRLAEQVWGEWGGQVEQWRADWSRHGRAAGFRRNAAMVAAGADICLAFIRDGSAGATHTAELAAASGIAIRHHTA